MRITDPLRGAWRRTVPAPVRRRIANFRKSPGPELRRYVRAIGWHAMTTAQRLRWSRDYNDRTTDFWLFIVGLHGSGTTLLKTILEQHAGIRSMPREGQYYTNAVPQAVTHGYVRTFTKRLDLFRLTEADSAMAALRAQYDWSFVYPRGRGIKLEKSSTNIIRARWLHAHFGSARLITLFRDPYSVCASTRRRRPKIPVEDVARQWKIAHELFLADLPHLERNVILYYEDLCGCPEEQLGRLSEFLGLTPALTRQMLPSLMPTTNNARDSHLPLQDLDEESRRVLTPEEMRTIRRIAGDTIARVGYSPEPADGGRPVNRLSRAGERAMT
jgi:hypothetical protein